MTTLILLCFGVFALKAFLRDKQQAELRKNNPDAWVRLKELEHNQKRLRHEGVKNATGLGLTIARLFMGK